MSSAREAMLARIRHAIGPRIDDRADDYAAISRSYQVSGARTRDERIELFVDRLHDYGAAVYRCMSADVAETIAGALAARSKRGMLVAPNVTPGWVSPHIEIAPDESVSYGELDRSEGVITGCALGIAWTGTIVLRHSAEAGRRALTLIPDYHLCIVRTEQIVETVAEGVRIMETFGTDPATTISGPSATSDIEMTRVKGVHGPRILDVVLVDGDNPAPENEDRRNE